MTYNVIVE